MSHFWLIPVIEQEPLIVGKARVLCSHPDIHEFRVKLNGIHARCLMMIKADTIPDDGTETICGGSADLSLPLDNGEDLEIELKWGVSHCARAFLDHLPSLEDCQQFYSPEKLKSQSWTSQQLTWLQLIQQWIAAGWTPMLIREG